MLSLSPELVPHVERLLPPLRKGTIRRDLKPLLAFARAAGHGKALKTLKALHGVESYAFEYIAMCLNEVLAGENSEARVVPDDLQALRDVIQDCWDLLLRSL